jgi:hypothetical protein
MRRCAIVALMMLALESASSTAARAQSSVPRGPAVLPFLGIGGFPRPRDIESGVTDTGQMLAGVGLDLPIAGRVTLAAAVARGFQPVACAGSCAPEGSLAQLALFWTTRAPEAKWGLLLGPTIERSTFDGQRVGVGGALAVGAQRGLGPRLLLRYLTLSGARRPTSLASFLAWRFGG